MLRGVILERYAIFATSAVTLFVTAFALLKGSSGSLSQEISHLAIAAPFFAVAVAIAVRARTSSGNENLGLAFALISANVAFSFAWTREPCACELGIHTGFFLTYFAAAAMALRAAQTYPATLHLGDLAGFTRDSHWRSALCNVWLASYFPWIAALCAVVVDGLGAISGIASLLIALLTIGYYVVQWRIGGKERRRKVLWLLQTVVSYFFLYAIQYTIVGLLSFGGKSQDAIEFVRALGDVAIALACGTFLGIGVLHTGAIHPSLVLRRTIVYGIATWSLLFILNVALNAGVSDIQNMLGVSDRVIAATIGAVAGLAFEPLATRIKIAFDRTQRRTDRQATHLPNDVNLSARSLEQKPHAFDDTSSP